jgi:hypothetical protein
VGTDLTDDQRKQAGADGKQLSKGCSVCLVLPFGRGDLQELRCRSATS